MISGYEYAEQICSELKDADTEAYRVGHVSTDYYDYYVVGYYKYGSQAYCLVCEPPEPYDTYRPVRPSAFAELNEIVDGEQLYLVSDGIYLAPESWRIVHVDSAEPTLQVAVTTATVVTTSTVVEITSDDKLVFTKTFIDKEN